MADLLKAKFLEVMSAVLPLLAVICLLQVLIVHAPLAFFLQFLAGVLLAVLGMLFLFVGIDQGILPMGRFIGAELPKKGSLALIAGVAFAVAFATTLAEPDVLVLATQTETASGGAIRHATVLYMTAAGVAIFAAIAMVRIVLGWPMKWILSCVYVAAVALALFAPAEFVPLAFDAGSVTTGVLTAPVVIALAFGLSSVLAGRSPVSDGFGLLGMASAGPIIVVLILGLLLS